MTFIWYSSVLLNSPVTAQYSSSICWSSGNKKALKTKLKPKKKWRSRMFIRSISNRWWRTAHISLVSCPFYGLTLLCFLQSVVYIPVYRVRTQVMKHQHKMWGVWIQRSRTEVEIQQGFGENWTTTVETRDRKRGQCHAHTLHEQYDYSWWESINYWTNYSIFPYNESWIAHFASN